jgi:hypothetical protein
MGYYYINIVTKSFDDKAIMIGLISFRYIFNMILDSLIAIITLCLSTCCLLNLLLVVSRIIFLTLYALIMMFRYEYYVQQLALSLAQSFFGFVISMTVIWMMIRPCRCPNICGQTNEIEGQEKLLNTETVEDPEDLNKRKFKNLKVISTDATDRPEIVVETYIERMWQGT